MKQLAYYQAGDRPNSETDIPTKYITENFVRQLSLIREPIDIADCRFTPPAAMEINRLISLGVSVRDTLNPERDALLANNAEAYAMQIEDTEHLPPSRVKSLPQLVEYMERLDKSVLYDIDGWKDAHLPLSVLIQMRDPEVRFDYKTNLPDLFKFLHIHLYKRYSDWFIENTESFLYIHNGTPVRFENTSKNFTDELKVPLIGTTTLQEMMSTQHFIPEYFGQISIFKDKEILKHWGDVVMRCSRTLSQINRSLVDVLKECNP